MDYRWTKNPQGQFVDGHERDNVVSYRNNVFIPAIKRFEASERVWTVENDAVEGPPPFRRTVAWWHDESTFYANDRRKIRWVHKGEKAVPYAKGEGASQMVADFVSADYGWLKSPDGIHGKQCARVLFKAGKARQGYFTNKDILDHASTAMDILETHYPGEDHILIFDNATTHLKRADDALSALKMPKNIPKDNKNWGVEVNVFGENQKPVYGADGKVLKKTVKMGNGRFANGSPQSLYFADNDAKNPGKFKGMAVILAERGFANTGQIRAECAGFKCAKVATNCCCRRMLYNEPDFIDVESRLETHCKARGFQVIFLPKFHCELNFIEQCWGFAKRIYRMYPVSSKEADLEANVISALDSVPIASM
jgi:hypothetical protein